MSAFTLTKMHNMCHWPCWLFLEIHHQLLASAGEKIREWRYSQEQYEVPKSPKTISNMNWMLRKQIVSKVFTHFAVSVWFWTAIMSICCLKIEGMWLQGHSNRRLDKKNTPASSNLATVARLLWKMMSF